MFGGIDKENWDAITQTSVEELQTLLRMRTINPPGDEGPAIAYLQQLLEAEGIECTVVSCEGRPNLVARIKGTGAGGGPLLLAGHVDVVPVEEEHWDHDPFAGEIHDGYLFGRGAIDMKNMMAMCCMVMRLVKRSGVTPNRDLIFAAVADEELGCWHGSRFLVEEHPELVRAEYMIGEVGGFSLDIKGVRYYPVQIAEKGIARLTLTARGEPGHGSTPHQKQAVVRLSEAIAALGRTRLPPHPPQAVRTFVQSMAAHQKFPVNAVLSQILNPRVSDFILDHLLSDEGIANTFRANLSNTVTPTLVQAGQSINLIPGEASVRMDGRILPGQTAADLVREVREVVGPDIEIVVDQEHVGREDTHDDPLFRAIEDNVRAHDPEGVAVPYMIPGFSDAAYFGLLGTRCYGYSPLRFPVEDEVSFSKLFHGHNERIHVEGYRWGLGCLWDLVSRFLEVER